MQISKIFGKRKPVVTPVPVVEVSFTSLISSDMHSIGDITLIGNLRIDGHHEGKIKRSPDAKTPITVYIAHSGSVKGLVDVDIIIIDGQMVGTIKANNNLYSTGVVEGHAFYGDEMDITGNFNAHIQKLTERQRRISREVHEAKVESVSKPTNIFSLNKI